MKRILFISLTYFLISAATRNVYADTICLRCESDISLQDRTFLHPNFSIKNEAPENNNANSSVTTINHNIQSGNLKQDFSSTMIINSGDNSNTGPNSLNFLNLSTSSSLNVQITNNSNVTNIVNSYINTGYNNSIASNNAGNIKTGDVNFVVKLNSSQNQFSLVVNQ